MATERDKSAIVLGVTIGCLFLTSCKFAWLYWNPTKFMNHPKSKRSIWTLFPFVSFWHETMVIPATWGSEERARRAFKGLAISTAIQSVVFSVILALILTRPN